MQQQVFCALNAMKGVFISVLALSAVLANADCPYWNEFGEPIIHDGGAALATAAAMMVDMGIPLPVELQAPYEEWDLNNDGVLDKDQFTLLTELLCLPAGAQHPTVDIDALRSLFENNVDIYWTVMYGIFDYEAEVLEAAAQLRALSRLSSPVGGLREAITVCGMMDTEIDAQVFEGDTIPDNWSGKTYGDLVDIMYDASDGIVYLENQGLLGDPNSITRLTFLNEATAYLFAAMEGFDAGFLTWLFPEHFMELAWQVLDLANLNWDYLLLLFEGCGLDPVAIANAAEAVENSHLSPSLLPSPDFVEQQYDWEELFTDYTPEDFEELLDTIISQTFIRADMKVVHASPDAPDLDICHNDVALFEDVSFKEVTPYSPVTDPYPEFTYGFSAVEANGDCGEGVHLADVDMPNTFTMVVLNTYSNLESLVLDDNVAAPVTGTAKLRFVNASPDVGALDVVAGAQTLFANVPFKGVGAFIEVLPGAYTVDFMSAGKGEKALPPADIVLNSGSVYTLYAMGFAEGVEVEITEDVEAPDLVTITPPDRMAYFAGESFQLVAQVDPSVTPSAYAWYKDGALLEGMEEATLAISNAGTVDSGCYTVVVTLENLPDTSGSVLLSATSDQVTVIQPLVTIAGNRNVDHGDTIMLEAVIQGDVVPTAYTWTFDDDVISDETTITIPNATELNTGTYRVAVGVALNGYPDINEVVNASVYVRVGLAMPATGLYGIVVLALLLSLALYRGYSSKCTRKMF